MSLEVRPLDATDPAALAAWHATYLAAETFGRDHPVPWMREEMRADFLGQRTGERLLPFGGYVGEEVVSCGLAVLPLQDNRTIARINAWTHPDLRGRGHGATMLEHLTGVAREAGRDTLLTEVALPYDAPADGGGHPDALFLTRRGFEFDLGDVMRVMDLPADEERLGRLTDEVAPAHDGYTLRQFVGPVPDDILLPFGELVGSLVSEAPSGQVDWEREVFDEERIRADEAVFEASGRTKYTTVAVAPGGDVVGYSELVVPRHDPGHVFQWGTLVHPGHRGHRLGLALKAHNLLFLQREVPVRGTLVTYNAEVNQHMIAVNEALGFRPAERLAEFRKTL